MSKVPKPPKYKFKKSKLMFGFEDGDCIASFDSKYLYLDYETLHAINAFTYDAVQYLDAVANNEELL